MIVYFIMLVSVTGLCALFSFWTRAMGTENRYISNNKYPHYYTSVFFWGIVVALSVPYVIRYYVGSDFDGYYFFYDYYAKYYSLSNIMSMRDWGYYLLAWVTHHFTDGNWYAFVTILAILTYAPIVYYYKRYAYKFTFAVMIYIMFMCYFGGYNAVRQSVAIAFTTLAGMCLIDKKYVKFAIFAYIAYVFHATTIIALPFILLSLIDSKNRFLTAIKGVLIISVFFMTSTWQVIMNMLGAVGQDKLYDDYSSVDVSTAHGSGYLRLLVYLVPVIIMLLYDKRIYTFFEDKKRDLIPNRDKYINYWINCIHFAAIFMFASTRYWIFARVAAFFAVYIPIVISHITVLFNRRTRMVFYGVTIVLYFIYMYMMVHTESDLLPFRTEWGWIFN